MKKKLDYLDNAKNILIYGYGVEGKANFEFLEKFYSDKNIEIYDENIEKFNKKLNFNDFDVIFLSPGISKTKIKNYNGVLTSGTKIFFELLEEKDRKKIIAVVGTKGKSTTVKFTAELLGNWGKKVEIGGNFGKPLLSFFSSLDNLDYVVAELSSYQLDLLKISPEVVLFVSFYPDHLDYHKNMEEYFKAKANSWKYQNNTDKLFITENYTKFNKLAVEEFEKIQRKIICPILDLNYFKEDSIFRGQHFLENFGIVKSLAEYLKISDDIFEKTCDEFETLSHRSNIINTRAGVDFVNDANATTPEASLAGINLFQKDLDCLILGGQDRGYDFGQLVKRIIELNIKVLILDSESGEKIKILLEEKKFTNYIICTNMEELVKVGYKNTKIGKKCLLSMASPSYGYFKNFIEKGEEFEREIQKQEFKFRIKPFKIFCFENYSFNKKTKEVILKYSFDSEVFFEEKLKFNFDIKNFDGELLDRVLFGLWVVSGVSYYKAYLPEKIEFKKGGLDKFQSSFFEKTWRNGLGEFFYINKIDFRDLIKFPISNEINIPPVESDLSGLVVPLGGGKDSLTTVSLLEEKGEDFELFTVGDYEIINKQAKKINKKHLKVKRIISSKLIELNKDGYKKVKAYNGHVPISSIWAFIGLIICVLRGKSDLVLSNEKSASEGNVEMYGVKINHQYSKSLEFENDLQEYIKKNISFNLNYYSYLRKYDEIEIMEIFVKKMWSKFKNDFTSCNKNFTLVEKRLSKKLWCGECAKCAFVSLLLSNFISRKEHEELFKKDMFLKNDILDKFYKELAGIEGFKPFECVGTSDEVQKSIKKAFLSGEYPELENYIIN